MPYSESLAERIRHLWTGRRGIVEKRMFGGVGFLLRGNMCVGVWKTSLIARLGPVQAAAARKQPGVREFDITGRPMKGWVMIDAEGVESDERLSGWLELAAAFVATLPAK